MILVGLSIFAAIALLVAIVWALHRHQQQKNLESVDRNIPLAPVEFRESAELSAEDMLDHEPRKPSPAPPLADTMPLVRARPTADKEVDSENWLEKSRELLQTEQYAAALAACHSALPQMGAFRQACQVLRSQVRAEKKNKQRHEQTLLSLYRFAAWADFFHSRTAPGKPLPAALLRRVNSSQWQHLDCPYVSLGFANLSLLTKTDTKWLQDAWGEPEQHSDMRTLHMEQWLLLTQT